MWASWKPGTTRRPVTSMTRVRGPINGRTSDSVPTNTRRPDRTPRAVAGGPNVGENTFPPTRATSTGPDALFANWMTLCWWALEDLNL